MSESDRPQDLTDAQAVGTSESSERVASEAASPLREGVERYVDPIDAKMDLDEANYARVSGSVDYEENLEKAFREYSRSSSLREGELIQWKPSLKNLAYPHYGRPVVFIRYMTDEELKNPQDSLFAPSSSLWDCFFGFIDGDGDFVLSRGESRRFQPYKSA